ncbi:MAG: hypothetical protein IPM24_09590 [Bryobacterales bacterium]|nr:hypothetical protein [Bryobacterales bacterium]
MARIVRGVLAALSVVLIAHAQEPDATHLQDPTLILDRGSEGRSYLVLPRGLTQITLGAERKRGDDRRDANGTPFRAVDRRYPDFRYAILNMGFGLGKGLELAFTLPYTWASDFYETPRNFYSMANRFGQQLDRCGGCTGLTDSWLTLKYQPLRDARFPLVVQGDMKFPEIYRHSNPYMGSRAHDFHLSAWTFWHNRHVWFSPRAGHLWRGGSFGDSITYLFDTGWRPSTSRKAHNFYVRMRVEGNDVHNGGKPDAGNDRYRGSHELAPGRLFSYRDAQGTRIAWSAGLTLAQWNFEFTYARWLAWRNRIGFREWGLQASRPLVQRELVKGDRILAAPTQAEVRAREPNSITLAPGEGFAATIFDWKRGQNRHDDQGRPFDAAGGRQHDFRFLTQYLAYGLPKGFEVSALVPYLWGREAFEDPNRNFSHTGLNDIWLSVRKQVLYNDLVPLGVAAEFKFTEPIRHADRWLGELTHDIMISAFSVKAGTNWWAAPKVGYKWREGAFSDEVPYVFDTGYRPGFLRPLRDMYVKGLFTGNFSLNNHSPASPKDRFGNLNLAAPPDHYFTFNAGAQHRAGFGVGFRLIQNWNVEIINHEYLATRNNNAYERDWTIGLARWF